MATSGNNAFNREEYRECDGFMFSPPAGGRDPFEHDCTFAAEVEVTYDADEVRWECPECFTEHVEHQTETRRGEPNE